MNLKNVPDRVPFIAQMHEIAMKWRDESVKTFYCNPEVRVHKTLETMADFEFDNPWLGYDVFNIESETMGLEVACPDNHLSTGPKFRVNWYLTMVEICSIK